MPLCRPYWKAEHIPLRRNLKKNTLLLGQKKEEEGKNRLNQRYKHSLSNLKKDIVHNLYNVKHENNSISHIGDNAIYIPVTCQAKTGNAAGVKPEQIVL